MSKKLKPCPFCGGEANVNISRVDTDIKQVFCPNCGANNLWGKDAIELWNKRKKEKIKRCPICKAAASCHEGYDGIWIVQCHKCFLTSPCKSTRQEAIEAWNRRIDND